MDPMMLIFLVLIFAVFYFLLIRPQRKRQSEHRMLIEGLQKGDKVITIGGIYGEIDSIDEQELILRVEDGSRLKLLRT
ncbi:preprotein translocase subunit YajC, partial [Dehalococcoidia bacterium]|nr:preprotein translocase subunit YajC [Dehalococcoidia bacterium]